MTEMTLIQTGIEYRIYPTAAQAQQLRQAMGSRRFVYNHFLAKRKERYEASGQNLDYKACCNELPALKKAFVWLKDVPSQVLQQSIKDLDTAYRRFFKKQSAYPQFKRKGRHESARFPQGFKWNFATEQTFLPKIGWIKTVFHRPLLGEVRSITVSMTPSGKFYASFLCRYEIPAPVFAGSVIGIDLGLSIYP